MNSRSLLFLILMAFSLIASGQQDSTGTSFKSSSRPSIYSLILPAGLIGYGVVALHNHALQSFDHNVREKVWVDNPHGKFPADDFLQFAPGAAVYLLNAVGIEGKHKFWDRTIIYVIANGIMGVTIGSMKRTISSARPDGSGNNGFPSGTVGTAFVAAEFMRQEYKDVSVWYGIGGYAAAVGTAFLRLYNDKHWFSQLLPGAGIGILSTKIAYWVYPFIQQKLFKNKSTSLIAMPFYQSGSAGISVNYFFH
jgi:membrane-associated phospholipid phosphatase